MVPKALHLVLRALGIGPGDEVITAANTFIATVLAIHYTGASPVFVDVDPSTYLIDVELIERAITPRTKAILPVHLYGQPANMHEIQDIATRHGLPVVADACRRTARGFTRRRWRRSAPPLASAFIPARTWGPSVTAGRLSPGTARSPSACGCSVTMANGRKTTLRCSATTAGSIRCRRPSSAIKLRHLEQGNQQRRRAAAKYCELLQNSEVILPAETPDVTHAYHLFVVRHQRRDELLAHLQSAGVQCGIHYPTPIHEIQPFHAAHGPGGRAGQQPTCQANSIASDVCRDH